MAALDEQLRTAERAAAQTGARRADTGGAAGDDRVMQPDSTAADDHAGVSAAATGGAEFGGGYTTGEPLHDARSIKVEVDEYSTITDSHPHTVTKTYELAHNDRSLVLESIQSDGVTLPLTGLSWSEFINVEDLDVPDSWTATATYSKATSPIRWQTAIRQQQLTDEVKKPELAT